MAELKADEKIENQMLLACVDVFLLLRSYYRIFSCIMRTFNSKNEPKISRCTVSTSTKV